MVIFENQRGYFMKVDFKNIRLLSISLLVAALFMLPIYCFAQCCGATYASNEIGTRLLSLQNASTMGGRDFSKKNVHFGFLNGIHYKRYFNFSAFRTSFDYAYYSIEKDPVCVDCEEMKVEGKVKGGSFKAGWEFIWVLNRFESYVAVDIAGRYGTFDGNEEGPDSNGVYQRITDHRQKWGLGLVPSIGFRVFPVNILSFSVETSLEGLLGWTTLKRINMTDAFQETSKIFRPELLFHPIGNFSINVMF